MPFPNRETPTMDETEESGIWTAFEEVAPNLCYIARTRETLSDLVSRSGNMNVLLESIRSLMVSVENPSFRTDLKILGERLHRLSKRTLLER